MINQQVLRPKDMGRSDEQLIKLEAKQLMPLYPPYDKPGMEPPLTDPKPAWKEKFCTSLDGYVGISMKSQATMNYTVQFIALKFLGKL